MKKSIYRARFFRRIAVALRTGLAVLLVGLLLLYVNAVWNAMFFPAFAPVVAIICSDTSAGKVLRNVVGVTFVSIFTLCSSLFILQFVVLPMHFALTIVCIGVSSFFITYPTKLHLLGKKVGLAQISILYVSAHVDPNMNRLWVPSKLICSTTIGATCAVVAILIPYPRLAVLEVIKCASTASRGQSELFQTAVSAFSAVEASNFASLCLHSKMLSKAAAEALTELQEKEAEVWWELKWRFPRTSAFTHVVSGLSGINLHLRGMEMALQSGYVLLCPEVLRSTLQDSLMNIANHGGILLENARNSMSLFTCSRTFKPSQFVELIEEGELALKKFDEALLAARLRAYYTPDISQLSESGILNQIRSESHFWKSNDFSPVKCKFMTRVAVNFYLFNLRLCFLEAMYLVDADFKLGPIMHDLVVPKKGDLELEFHIPNATFNLPGVPEHSTEANSATLADAATVESSSVSFQPYLHQPESSQCKKCPPECSPPLSSRDRWIWLKNSFTMPDRGKSFRALKTAFAMMLAVIFGILSLPGDVHSAWAPVTVSFIMGGHRGGSFRMASLRIQGTVMGSIYGYLAISATENCNYCTLIALTFWVTVSDYIRYSKTHGYSGLVSAVTASIMMLGDFGSNVKQYAMDRIAETFIGVMCLIFVESVVWPDRAVILVRTEVVSSLLQLRDCAAAILTAYTGEMCIQCRILAVEHVRQLEKDVKARLSKQADLRTEAALEPELWFVPFPEDVYLRIITIQTSMLDLLFFMLCSLQATMDDCLGEHMQKLLEPLRSSMIALEEQVLSTVDSLRKVLEKSPNTLGSRTLHAFLRSIFCFWKHSVYNQPDDVQRLVKLPHDVISIRRHPLLVLGNRRRSVGGTPLKYKTTIDHFELSFESVMEELIATSKAGKGQVINNSVMLSISSLSFCLHALFRETVRLEKAVYELLQAENPQSVVDFYVNEYRPSKLWLPKQTTTSADRALPSQQEFEAFDD